MRHFYNIVYGNTTYGVSNLYFTFEKSRLKNQVQWTGSLTYKNDPIYIASPLVSGIFLGTGAQRGVTLHCTAGLWQYHLWSFKSEGSKLVRPYPSVLYFWRTRFLTYKNDPRYIASPIVSGIFLGTGVERGVTLHCWIMAILVVKFHVHGYKIQQTFDLSYSVDSIKRTVRLLEIFWKRWMLKSKQRRILKSKQRRMLKSKQKEGVWNPSKEGLRLRNIFATVLLIEQYA